MSCRLTSWYRASCRRTSCQRTSCRRPSCRWTSYRCAIILQTLATTCQCVNYKSYRSQRVDAGMKQMHKSFFQLRNRRQKVKRRKCRRCFVKACSRKQSKMLFRSLLGRAATVRRQICVARAARAATLSVTRDRCYDFLNIFAEKFSEPFCVFCSNYCEFLQKL
jgi:hypothetical protein